MELNNVFDLIVKLQGSPTNLNFRGFMIQGRLRVDDSPVGKFGSGVDYKPQCSGNVSLIAAFTIVFLQFCFCYVDCCHSYSKETKKDG